MYKLNFVETIEREDCKINIYSNDYYEVGEKNYKNLDYTDIIVKTKNNNLPSIYVDSDIRTGEIKPFEIQTKSWGSLSPEELEEKIKGYQIAIETAKELNKMFLK